MSVIAAVGSAVPDHRYPQEQITEAFAEVVLGDAQDRLQVLRRLHASAQVTTRHLALPLADYAGLDGFTASNDAFIEVGLLLAERAVVQALAEAGLDPEDVDLVMSTTVTGVAAPSLDARLVARLGLRPDVKRVPMFGLGCVAGAAGVARLHDYLLGHPDEVAVLVAVELCSLTVQRDDTSMANLVASGLFGDGAAAVVMTGSARAPRPGTTPVAGPGTGQVHGQVHGPDADRSDGPVAAARPVVVASRSRMYPDTERVMGWDIGTTGFRIVLDATVPDIIEKYLRPDVDAFLAAHGLTVGDIGTWVAHPGGPKVLEAMQRCLELDEAALQLTWESLAAVGNLSSASVLQVLQATLARRTPDPGSHGLLLAMGPGFCAELVLLRW